jgi:hypothetical protein
MRREYDHASIPHLLLLRRRWPPGIALPVEEVMTLLANLWRRFWLRLITDMACAGVGHDMQRIEGQRPRCSRCDREGS